MKKALVKLARKVASSDKLFIIASGVLLSLLVSLLYGARPQFLEIMDMKVYDQMLRRTYTNKTTGVPVIVDLDEKSLAEFGQWPWPRFRVALLMAKIAEAGALGVGMDILFSEPDRTSPARIQKDVKQDLQVDMTISGLPAGLEDFDVLFGNVLKSGPYSLGFYLTFGGEAAPSTRECLVKDLPMTEIKKPGSPRPEAALLTADGAICPLPVLAGNAPAAGYINSVPDADGILRRVPLVIMWKGKYYPSLALSTLLTATRQTKAALRLDRGGVESVRLGDRTVPLDPSGNMYVKFRGPRNAFKYVSAADVLHGKVGEETLKGKVVFIGTSAAGLLDIRATPLDPVFPGVETHANIVDNILSSDFLTRPLEAQFWEGIATAVCGLLLACLMAWAGAVWALIPVAGMAFGLWEAGIWFMSAKHMVVSPLYPLIAIGTNFTVLTLVKFWREEGQKKFLHATFASYLSPELIHDMVESKTMPELGGEARTITAYFTDIQAFSTFSEILTAHQLVELLNEYLSAMTDILMAEKGTLDKYEGDAIMAFFGAPIDLPDNPVRACRAALAMQAKLILLREKWKGETVAPGTPERNSKNLPPERWAPGSKWPAIVHDMRMRIGINTGEIVVGNMGSSMRMNYTMMGDSVNLAARLEAGSKQYGVFSMLSEFVLDTEVPTPDGPRTVRELVEVRYVDRVAVVGKAQPVAVYELWAMKGEHTQAEEMLRRQYDAAMALYLDMKWDEALAGFEKAQALERFPTLKITPSKVFIERCKAFRENPPVAPGETWDGVYRMTQK